jgi:hypothetical protein
VPAALNLGQAANEAYLNLQAKWNVSLKNALNAFWQAVIDTFPDQETKSHPTSNWIVIIASMAERMNTGNGDPNTATAVPIEDLINAANAVYRLCLMTRFLQDTGQITAAQGSTGPNSILVRYNAFIA